MAIIMLERIGNQYQLNVPFGSQSKNEIHPSLEIQTKFQMQRFSLCLQYGVYEELI